MRILVTNDDGIRARSLECVVQWAKKLGEVERVKTHFRKFLVGSVA
jgi:broad specificity polyphosphatase/5'/3'-nucleotidase SurE